MRKAIILLPFLFYSVVAFANGYFTSTRSDVNVPEHCRETKMEFFLPLDEIQFVFYGIQGAKNKKSYSKLDIVNYEINLSRKGVRKLWYIIKGQVSEQEQVSYLKADPLAQEAYEELSQSLELFSFSWVNEGDILEALALMDLMKIWSKEEYYVTGGVSYQKSKKGAILGELDLIVARRLDCKIVVIGESKLGNRLGKATKQLERIHRFVIDNSSVEILFSKDRTDDVYNKAM